MKYSYNWLKELSGTKLSAEKAAELLTMRAMELEGVEKAGAEFGGVVVGKILEVKKHPNADKLRLAKVDVGKETLDIVCGAPNIEAGQKVPVALVGAVLPGDFEIKAAEIRGEKSNGMLCAPDELGLGDDHSGIMILKNSAKVGESFAKYLGMDDTIFEIKVLPDRAHDALSHVGVAREIAVLSGKELEYDFDGLVLPKIKKVRTGRDLSVRINDKKLCSRYIGAVMIDVEIKPSPDWMQARLRSSGIRPINNIVDATNYVMLELGQPMHAFDAEKLKIKDEKLNIVVRRAKNKEKLVLLDDSELELNETDLLITNGETPLALAGIMGGMNSGINENTRAIVLEAAAFNATNVRRTRTRLNLKTDASDRFEKEIDPNLCEKAMTRIIEILEHTAGAKLEGVEDVYPVKIKPWKIKLDLEYANNLLGEAVPKNEAVKILKSLGIKIENQKSKILNCVIPTFRVDMRTQEDLIEEIGRIRGYDKIIPQALMEPVEPAHVNAQVFFERRVKEILAGLGSDEVYNYSFYSRKDADWCGLSGMQHYELANPMSPEQELVRVSLVPNILKNVRENLKHFEFFSLFEIGRCYYPEKNETREMRMLLAAQVLEKDANAETFYSMKGMMENLLESLGLKNQSISVESTELPANHLGHPVRNAEIKINNAKCGYLGEINPSVLRKYKIGKRVAIFEFDLEKLLSVLPKTKKYHPIGKFPTVTRDVSMIVPEGVTYFQIEKLVRKSGGRLVENVELFDYFKAKKSLAIRILMNAEDRTLESAEVDTVMEKIVSSLEKELKVEVRK